MNVVIKQKAGKRHPPQYLLRFSHGPGQPPVEWPRAVGIEALRSILQTVGANEESTDDVIRELENSRGSVGLLQCLPLDDADLRRLMKATAHML